MKRRLISFDTFKKIEETSLTKAQNELIEAETVLAKTLGLDGLQLHTFGENDVTYKTNDGDFVHATYKLDNDKIILENVELLVIDTDTEKKTARETLSAMIDSILENKEFEANSLFESYMSMPAVRRDLMVNEAFKVSISKGAGKKSPLKGKRQPADVVAKRIKSRLETLRKTPKSVKAELARKRKAAKSAMGSKPKARVYVRKVKPKTMKEWLNLCENVMGYLDYQEHGMIVRESYGKTDDNGNLVALAIPTTQKRNEAKVLSMGYKTLDSEVKVLRGNMKKISEDQTFIKAMADLKRYNNISDDDALEETLEAIVSHFPDVLYINEAELAEQIATALESANISNYDEKTCLFMAEAILRTAHNAYTDRVRKISKLAGSQLDVTAESKMLKDAYKEFTTVAQDLFNKIDENTATELQIFADLFTALNEVHRIALESGDEATRVDIADYMRECHAILNSAAPTDMELAEDIASYLADLLEASGEGDAGIDNEPEVSVGGEHSMTKWNAKQSNVPSNQMGGWKSAAPVSDGKDYGKGLDDEMGNHGFSNLANSDTWPDIKNPYIPKADMPKMKEKSAADEDGLGSDIHKDTWPNLSNPLSPKAGKVMPVE